MNVRNATVALVAGATLMTAMTGAANAQETTAKKTKTNAASATKRTTRRSALPPTAASRSIVSIDAKNAPVQQALERLFRDAKAQYILDNNVSGYVNLKIVNQPFENALRLVLRSSTTPLTYSRDGNVYIIRPAATVRTTPTVAVTPNNGAVTGDVAVDGVNNEVPLAGNAGVTATVPRPTNILGRNDPYYNPYVVTDPTNSPYYQAKVNNGAGFGTPSGLDFSPFGFGGNGFVNSNGFANGGNGFANGDNGFFGSGGGFSSGGIITQSGGFYNIGNTSFYNPWGGGFLFGN